MADGAVVTWLVLANLAMAVVATEIAGVKLPGWRTITGAAEQDWRVKWLVAALFAIGGVGGFAWWLLWHLPRS